MNQTARSAAREELALFGRRGDRRRFLPDRRRRVGAGHRPPDSARGPPRPAPVLPPPLRLLLPPPLPPLGPRPAPPVVVIDISEVFKQHSSFNQQLNALKDEIKTLDAYYQAEQKKIVGQRDKLASFNAGSPEYKKLEEDLARIGV
jgi:hypothetical protein